MQLLNQIDKPFIRSCILKRKLSQKARGARDLIDFIKGENYEGALLELVKDPRKNQPRVVLVDAKPDLIYVEFPRGPRTEHPLGTLFRADVKVTQKTEKQGDGSLRGKPYARAVTKTIEVVEQGASGIYATEIRDRVFRWTRENSQDPLAAIRAAAIKLGVQSPERRAVHTGAYVRSAAVVKWVRARAGDYCEGCGDPAPFKTLNGAPYFEVHHIKALSEGGEDTIKNTIALCPNCHRRTEYAADAAEFNQTLAERLKELEPIA